MTQRNFQWDLVGQWCDPVQADLYAVRAEGRHYSGLADDLRDQVTALREMTDPHGDLIGHYAEELREACGELADDLDKVQNRFQVLGDQISGYAAEGGNTATQCVAPGALFNVLERTEEAVRAAQELAQEYQSRDTDADDDDTEPYPPTGWGAKSAEEREVDAALEEFNAAVGRIADVIEDAADDDMKPGFWERVKNATIAVLKVLKQIITVLTVIVAVLALFVPGLNLIVLGLLVTSLAVNLSLLALGEGSLADIGMDILGLATFGLGSLVGALAKAGRAASVSRTGNNVRNAASNSRRTQIANRGGQNGRGGGGPRYSRQRRQRAQRNRRNNNREVSRAGRNARNRFNSGANQSARQNLNQNVFQNPRIVVPRSRREFVDWASGGFNADTFLRIRDARNLQQAAGSNFSGSPLTSGALTAEGALNMYGNLSTLNNLSN